MASYGFVKLEASVKELESEAKALRDLVRTLQSSEGMAWAYCRLAQKLFFQLHRSSWITPEQKEELANQIQLDRPFDAEKMEGTYKGLEDWLPVPLVRDQVPPPPPVIPEGDVVSIIAEDSEFSDTDSLVSARENLIIEVPSGNNHHDSLHAGHTVRRPTDEDQLHDSRHALEDRPPPVNSKYLNAPAVWMNVDMPLDNDVLVVSDSMLKSLDVNFVPGRQVEVYPFSGLRCAELVDILSRQHERGVKARCLFICVGTNDYHRASSESIIRSFRAIVSIATKMSSRVVLFNIPDSRWKGKHGDYRRNVQARKRVNAALNQMKTAVVGVFDMDFLFNGHCGFPEQNGHGWYQKDAIHPNASGMNAIEESLRQVVCGVERVKAPSPDKVTHTYEEIWFRKDIIEVHREKCPRKPRQERRKETTKPYSRGYERRRR